MNNKQDIRLIEKEDLIKFFIEKGESKFRAQQVLDWLWKKGAHSFAEMTNLSKNLRSILEEHFEIRPITFDTVQHSSDGTIKTRFKLHDGHYIESVLIPVKERDRYTVCISCQVGCSLTCSFCATGQMKRMRNLDAPEIFDQVLLINRQCLEVYEHPLTNIVYMGMGEPLLTYSPVVDSLELICSENGLGISPKRVTISTAGIAKMIKKMADDGLRTNLALSLHAADDFKRNQIMPINEQNNLAALVEALQYFYNNSKDNKITFEYIAFKDFNDNQEDAENLLKLCRRVPTVKVNIIEYNNVDGVGLEKSEDSKIDSFARYLNRNGVAVTVRKSRGKDIDAACGQLANK
jgi:23S rRNA (adenine2503-C2)-methyltransferase